MRTKDVTAFFLLILLVIFVAGSRSRYDPGVYDDLRFNDADTFFAVETVIKTINLDSSDDNDDFEFDDTAGDVTEQTVDMGAIIPAYAELLSAQLRCFETVGDSNTMAIDVGTSDGGNQIMSSANTDAANDINATAAGDGPEIVATAAAKNVWINATPANNWDTLGGTGRWSVMVTYIDYGAVHTGGIP